MQVNVREQLRGSHVEVALLAIEQAGGQLSLSEMRIAVGGDFDGSDAAEQLRQFGLARKDPSLAGEVTLTPAGRSMAQAIQVSQVSGPDRRGTVQKALLRWVRGRHEPNTDAFVHSEDSGAPFTEREVLDAVVFAEQNGLLTGIKTAESDHLLRAKVTALGLEVMDTPMNPFDFLRLGGSTSIDNRSSTTIGDGNTIGAVASGVGNVQHVQQSITTDQRIQIMAAVADLIRGLPDDTPDEVKAAVNDIGMEAAKPHPVLAAIKEKAATAMATALATGVANDVVTMLHTLIQNHLS